MVMLCMEKIAYGHIQGRAKEKFIAQILYSTILYLELQKNAGANQK